MLAAELVLALGSLQVFKLLLLESRSCVRVFKRFYLDLTRLRNV